MYGNGKGKDAQGKIDTGFGWGVIYSFFFLVEESVKLAIDHLDDLANLGENFKSHVHFGNIFAGPMKHKFRGV